MSNKAFYPNFEIGMIKALLCFILSGQSRDSSEFLYWAWFFIGIAFFCSGFAKEIRS